MFYLLILSTRSSPIISLPPKPATSSGLLKIYNKWFLIWERERERWCIWRVDKNIRHASQVWVFNKPGQAKCFQLNHAYVQFLTPIGSRVHIVFGYRYQFGRYTEIKLSIVLEGIKEFKIFFYTQKKKCFISIITTQ